jgi:ergothioneine biosynthesis protein EgtB
MIEALIPPARIITREALLERYQRVRRQTEALAAPLAIEDTVVQTSTECSPVKWHLAHTTWFFETFVLASDPSYSEFNSKYNYLFNSYYNTIGDRTPRPARGLMSRPTLKEVGDYRAHADRAMEHFFNHASENKFEALKDIIMLGTHHEQQHQELIITDVKTVLAMNSLRPVYRPANGLSITTNSSKLNWIAFDGGLVDIGTDGPGFYFDNEGPRHQHYLEPLALADRLVSNGEYKEFIADGGYRNALLWLSDGFAKVVEERWEAPKYWEMHDDEWWHMTLRGFEPVNDSEPVTHVSHYEADAFARWSGARLPTEFEWEHAATTVKMEGNFLEDNNFHPVTTSSKSGLQQMFGDAWEWTQSAYLPYPRYRPAEGAIGEYNGKFMSNQMVLRGGSCATPRDHIRATYRNFFPPEARWQFSGIRLARMIAHAK